VLKGRVIRRIFGHVRGEATRRRARLKNEDLHDMFAVYRILWDFYRDTLVG
jgi:hypothetical protein